MNPLNHIDERWFFRTLFWLSLAASLALVVAHQVGYGLRPAERVEESAPGPAAP
jgi:hypothetical protein